MSSRPAPQAKLKSRSRYRTLPAGTGLSGTITATDAVKRASTVSLPYRTAGNINHTTKRLFSSYNYMSDPQSSPFTQSYSHVNPFPVTTLPTQASLTSSCSAPTPNSSPAQLSTTAPLYFAPLTPLPGARPQLRQHTAPVSSSGRTVAPCHEMERSWWSEPYVEQAYSSLYRAVRADRSSTAWRATNHIGGEFNNHTHCPTQDTPSSSHKKSRQPHSHRVQHLDAWNVADGQGSASIGGRHSTDIHRMAGGVDTHESSQYELSERVMSGLHARGMRDGHRSGLCVGSNHSHPNVMVAGSGLRDEKQYHSRKSADGRCYHHCTGSEVKTSSE